MSIATSATPAAPPCPGPDPAPRAATRLAVPPGAVDTHAHVIGGSAAYPFVAGRGYTPPPATEAQYLRMLDATGMARGVLVQVSVHGTDNRLMLETLRAHPERLRGVAVVELGRPAAEYAALKAAGIVGLRLNLLFAGGGAGLADLASYGALCREMGWHLQFLLDARTLPEVAPLLARLDVPLVFDHMGAFPMNGTVDEPGFQTLLSLMRDGAWVKLSGAYRVADPPYTATVPFARALHAAAPGRCVWGSDWPQVATYGAMPNVGALLDLLADWVPDAAAREAVLVGNAVRLYGF